MNGILRRRFQLQLALISAAVVLVAVVSVLLIGDAVRGAERLVVTETAGALAAAVSELGQQYVERAAAETDWLLLPVERRDISLRGVSGAVLQSYPGAEGGYYATGRFLGYSYPTHNNPAKRDVPEAEAEAIRVAARQSLASGRDATTVQRGSRDVVVIRTHAVAGTEVAAWAMRRIVGLADPAVERRRWLLAGLIVLALLSLAVTLAASVSLARGVQEIKSGLAALESDFRHNLPERSGELGEIARAVNRMVSLRQKLEAELRREDRLRSMGRLVAAVAHEVRNPLNGIRLSAQLLARQTAGGGPQIDAIIEEVDRLDRLVRDLLVFEKHRPVRIEPSSVISAVEGAWALVRTQAETRGIRFETRHSDLPVALFDGSQLRQALLNLFLNAIEAMPAGGALEVEIAGSAGWVAIRISNSGPPLSVDQQDRLFEMFYSTKPEGSGLGLAVSREVVENMGGRLEYDPAAKSPAFVVRLPRPEL